MIEFEINTNKKQIDFEVTQGIPKYVPANFQSKTVIPTTEQQIVRADSGYDGLEQVTVEKINLSNKTITENGTYNAENENVDGYSSVEVNVQPTLQEKSVTITENGTTEVVADHGYDGLAKVSVEVNVQGGGGDQAKGLIERTLTEISNSDVTAIGNNAFYNYTKLTSVYFPNITSIGGSAFYNCKSLTSVNIGNSVTSIGDWVFAYCSGLPNITIPNSVTSIGNNAFAYCVSFSIVDFRSATQIPTIQSRSFSGVLRSCKFIIPDELYDSWITATNWASLYANGYQFIKASEYTEA